MSRFKPQYRRLLFIDRKLRSGAYPNCSSLAADWEVSARTIQRDLDYLRDELEAPIAYDAERRGFYYEDPSWFLPSVILSEGDLVALLIGQQALQMYEGTPVAEELKRIYAKLAEWLPESISVGPEFVESRFSFLHPPARSIAPEIWRQILRSLLHQRELEISYRSPASQTAKPHRIHPYHVVNAEGDWYLLAREVRWDDITQFAISRVVSARITEARFEVPADFDAVAVCKSRFGRYLHTRGGKVVRVRLLVEPTLAHYVSEKVWHPEQRLKRRRDGRVELSIPVLETRDIEAWVLSLGEHVKVLSPSGLAEQVRRRHRLAARG